MRIQAIMSQHRRDFTAIYECEHCGHTEKGDGYDDRYFHENIILKKVCVVCGKTAGDAYQPLATKYADHEVV